LPVGTLPVNIRITYQINQKIMTCWNDNHRGSSHAPLPVYISEQDLPCLNNCLYGETHAHTIFSSDQVEFAASLETSAKMASFIGLDFLCATDHYYDLDDQPDNYLLHDPDLKKWHQFLQEVQQYNKQNTFQIIPGEEVTVRNRQNKNIHCLVYNSERFFHGSGDSAEKWLRTRSELSIPELLAELPPEACAFAAHPAEQPPFLQRILINRGHWQVEDCANDLLHGLQFLNHSGAAIDADGRRLWIRMLLGGFRLVGLAGNDAHGNFSRSRQIGIPFLTMRENYLHLFGYWRTGVYTADNRKDMPAILKSMRDGACFMTNGPALCLQAFDQNKWQHTGSRLTNITRIRLAAQSNKEFSEFKQARILMGLVGTKQEQSYFQHDFEPGQETYDIELDFLPQEKNGYFRAEVTTRSGKEALSNPIWF